MAVHGDTLDVSSKLVTFRLSLPPLDHHLEWPNHHHLFFFYAYMPSFLYYFCDITAAFSQECGRTEFEKFLVDSPLSSASNDSPPLICSTADNTNNIDSNLYIPYGSYHQHYRIDGQLVAVGIIDILPSTLNSVYCFYDPDFRDLSLGKVVAMKEINWAQRCQQVRPDIQYYCLGFYVHTCSKMSYKVNVNQLQHEPDRLAYYLILFSWVVLL